MKLKKLLVMPLVVLSILMVGCQKDVDSSDTVSTSSQSVLESISVNTYHETMPVPVEGWTLELINEVIYINGRNISIPFTISDLGEGFEWDSETFSVFKTGEPSVVLMKYNEVDFALVSVYASNEEELNDGKIMGLYSMDKITNPCYINGVTVGSTDNQVINALGEPTEVYDPETVKSLYYALDGCLIRFSLDNGRVGSIIIKTEE